MTEKLKSCPFCGWEAKLTDLKQAPESWVECTECGARTRFFSNSEEDAVSAWNARPIEDALQKELDEAREDNCENMEYHVAERERLKSENARLRKALEKYAAPEHHFSVVDGKVWEVFDNSYGVDEQEFGTWARNALNGMDK